MTKVPAILALLLAALPASASTYVRVQGTLADGNGRPGSGLARLDFRLVDLRTHHELWSEPLEVEAVNGVFVAFLGLSERLPQAFAVKSSWRLVAEPPLGSSWKVGALVEPEEDVRRAQLARLMVRLGMPAPEARVETPYEYRRLLAEGPAGHAPPETISTAPECAEGGAIDGTCPRPLRRVLGREEKLLRDRLLRASRLVR